MVSCRFSLQNQSSDYPKDPVIGLDVLSTGLRKFAAQEPSRNTPTFAAEGETFECWDASWDAG